ncbi:hypothetical protein GGH12_000293 [Coemansia sp. RSA 1822]|nr:hypothetical protein GGH12_000293 [Coemansia sp. RSA 1822]
MDQLCVVCKCATYHEHDALISSLRKQFWQMIPIRLFIWGLWSSTDSQDENTTLLSCMRIQGEVMKTIIFHEHTIQYNPSNRYVALFLKTFIDKIERALDYNLDDELVEFYVGLAASTNTSGPAHGMCFKTYALDKEQYTRVVLKEEQAMISQGTTGLITWEAGLRLADFFAEHPGFVCAAMGAACVVSTDYSDAVLKLLESNRQTNPEISGKLQIAKLDWDDLEECSNLSKPIDVIIGADITYDPTIVPILVAAIKEMVVSSQQVVYITATIRNIETFDLFLQLVDETGVLGRSVMDLTQTMMTALCHPNPSADMRKSQQTLANSMLTPFVFANTALLWLIPSNVNHPLRRILGLSTPFILISAAESTPIEYKLRLRRTQTVVSGAEPLAVWEPLVLPDPDNVSRLAHCMFEWGVQRLRPMDRNQARMLTAQYAQILPELKRSEDDVALPMLVFTKEIDEVKEKRPFYLAVFSPSSPLMFANVVGVKARGEPVKQDAETVQLLEQSTGGARVQHWTEYDLLGSPAQAESSTDEFKADAADVSNTEDQSRMDIVTEVTRDTDNAGECADDEADSVLSVNLGSSMSYAVLHGIWTTEVRRGGCAVEIPPEPSPSAQWVLELLSAPLEQEPDASKPLRELHAEIKRLENWCRSWMAGTRWVDTQQTDEHRQTFAKKIDEFIDSSIHAARGSTSLGHVRDSDVLEGFAVREDLDFAERLWTLVRHARDDDDLSESIAAVAEGLETRKLQPYIRQSNDSPLAQVIRQALQMAQAKTLVDAEAEKERLAGQLDTWIDEQPLDPFVQVGLHKLRADFWFYFVSGHLATPRQVEPFLDTEKEPEQLVARFWLLLRVLEVWWLIQQAVPGMPRQFACQTVSALLDHFAAALVWIDRDSDEESDADASMYPQYENWLKTSIFLPVYSTEVQTFVAAIADGFDPARYTAAAIDPDTQDAGRSQYSLILLTKTPGLVDRHFSFDDTQLDVLADASSDMGDLDDYTVFEAQHI